MIASLLAAAGSSWLLAIAGCFLLAVVSAIFPWVAAEAVLVAFLALSHSVTESLAIVVILSAGQMAGKAMVFWGARRGQTWKGRGSGPVERWRARLTASSGRASLIVLASSLLGFPPFFLVTIAAGAFEVDFGRFMAAGLAGRLVRFAILALPQTLARFAG